MSTPTVVTMPGDGIGEQVLSADAEGGQQVGEGGVGRGEHGPRTGAREGVAVSMQQGVDERSFRVARRRMDHHSGLFGHSHSQSIREEHDRYRFYRSYVLTNA